MHSRLYFHRAETIWLSHDWVLLNGMWYLVLIPPIPFEQQNLPEFFTKHFWNTGRVSGRWTQEVFLFKLCFQGAWHNFLVRFVVEPPWLGHNSEKGGNQLGKPHQERHPGKFQSINNWAHLWWVFWFKIDSQLYPACRSRDGNIGVAASLPFYSQMLWESEGGVPAFITCHDRVEVTYNQCCFQINEMYCFTFMRRD